MSDQVSIGDYSLEISGDEVLVRDESGAIVDTVAFDEVEGELTLPDGRTVDLASIFSEADLNAFQTAAGPANDNTGNVEGGSGTFIPFKGTPGEFDGLESAGALDDTSLGFDALAEVGRAANDSEPQQQARSSFDWSRHETDPGRSEPSNNPPNPQNQSPSKQTSGGNEGEGEDDEIAPPSDLPSQNGGRSGASNQGDSSAPPTDQQQEVQNEGEDPANEQLPEDVNEAPTDIDLSGSTLVENVAGALVGALSAIDPDAGDSHSFEVSDDRFEVVNGELKLKDSISLDFETEPSLNIVVTATDSAGNKVQETFTLSVSDANEAQTALTLDPTGVAENAPGAVIGTLDVADPDAGDSQSFHVSDDRFEVVNGQLKLKDGLSLDHENEPSVTVKVTATDSAGHAIEQSFTIAVANVNEAPVAKATDGTVINHIVDTSESYDPQAAESAGGYLYGTKGASLSTSDLSSGISTEDLTLFAPTDVTVTFQKEGAGHRNMIGVYRFDDDGNIIPGSVEFIWLDATANTENKIGAPLTKDFLGYSQSSTVSLGTLPEGTHLGFFMIANGAADNANKTLLSSAAAGTSSQDAAMDTIANQLSIKTDANGNGRVYVGDTELKGHTYFTHDKTLNTDFSGTKKDINHAVAGVSDKLPGQLLIGFEDLDGGGDKDYNDLVISVGMGTYNVNKLTQSAVQPTVDFSDIDSNTLSQAVITTSGFKTGDTLNIPPSNDFSVTVDQSGADVTITIVGKAGTETLDQYEDFANSIYFSTTSKIEGARHIGYSIMDDGGLTSNVSSADIRVSNQYELSTSELGKGQTTLGTGDDVLHINTDTFSPVRMGDGYDTVHLAQQGRSFDHQDAIKLENVEAIDATGYGANNVSLSIHDVLNMTDSDNRLTIIGDEGDTVTLTGSGNNQWTLIESNAEFRTYAYSDPTMQAVVEISNQMNAQVS